PIVPQARRNGNPSADSARIGVTEEDGEEYLQGGVRKRSRLSLLTAAAFENMRPNFWCPLLMQQRFSFCYTANLGEIAADLAGNEWDREGGWCISCGRCAFRLQG
ncbi:unnamed protein product, partial [Ectocarpus sp. 12 AP-2014]